MPNWLAEVLKLLGWGMPALYAYAVYRICLHFDKRGLSSKARKALSDWLRPKEYEKDGVRDAIIEIFDRIYTPPLLSWRTFLRSALLTICAYAIVFYETDRIVFVSLLGHSNPFMLGILVFRNVVLDYAGLFVVHWFLICRKESIAYALLLGPLCGMLTVGLAVFIVNFIWIYLYSPLDYHHVEFTFLNRVKFAVDITMAVTVDIPGGHPATLAALLVYLWLPLFHVCVSILRILDYFRAAVGMTQRILSRGGDHPLEAIGYVAATIVFVTTVALRWAFAT
jgi:hypothetical protein